MKHHCFKQSLVWMIITAHLVTMCGCMVTNRITLPGNELPIGTNFKIATLILKDGGVIAFDTNGGRYVEKTSDGGSYRVIVGTSDNKLVEIDPEKVLDVKFEQKEANGAGSFILGLLVGLPVGASLLVLIAAMSLNNE